jgi:hypothetical protein
MSDCLHCDILDMLEGRQGEETDSRHRTRKLFRDGDYPVLRGTALILDEKNAYLWTNGYVPQLNTYIGPETPNPLFITLLRSKYAMPKMETVLKDIVGLNGVGVRQVHRRRLPSAQRCARRQHSR